MHACRLISSGWLCVSSPLCFSHNPCSEFNYAKNANDECVLVPGTTPLPDDDSCKNDEEFWYERTAYRKIPYSSCEGGTRLDRGTGHSCPGFRSHGPLFWWFVILIPFMFTALVAYWYYRRSGMARGCVHYFFFFYYLIAYSGGFEDISDFLATVGRIMAGATVALWKPLRLFRGSSSVLRVLHGSGSSRMSSRRVPPSVHGEAIEISLLMRMRRF